MIGRRTFLTLPAAAVQPRRRPNILFAIADDWGPDQAAVLGDPAVKTPVFDRVAKEGVLFTNAFVAAPTCTASRAAILTGQMPHRLGAAINLSSQWTGIPPLFPDLLAAAGYHTGYCRKGWGPGEHPGRSLNPAGERYQDFAQFLSRRDPKAPFCFWFGSNDPHRGFERSFTRSSGFDSAKLRVPPYLPDVPEVRDDLADYYAEIQRFDAEVGQMIERLEAAGELENTIVVMTGDNGLPFPRAKGHLYDAGTRVPLAIRWGARAPAGRRVSDFVSHTDFAPTFLEIAGLAVPRIMTGRSYLNVLAASRGGQVDRARDCVFTERERHTWCHPGGLSYPVRAVRTSDSLLVWNPRPHLYPAGHPCLRRANGTPMGHVDCDEGPSKYFLIEHREQPECAALYRQAFGLRPEWELYDLKADPHQLHNRAGEASSARRLESLKARLAAWMKSTADPRASGETDSWDGGCVHLQPYADVRMPGYEAAEQRSGAAPRRGFR